MDISPWLGEIIVPLAPISAPQTIVDSVPGFFSSWTMEEVQRSPDETTGCDRRVVNLQKAPEIFRKDETRKKLFLYNYTI